MENLIQINSLTTIESREVAEMVGKEHSKLLRDIRGYLEVLGEAKIGLSDFFIPSEYLSDQNKRQPCFLLTKQGCEMVANKLTGKKGTLFTAKYVMRFNDMQSNKVDSSYMIDDPISRAERWIEEQKEKQKLIETNTLQAQVIAEFEPRLSYLDTILSSTDTVTITQIAADYGMSAVAMNKLLNKLGIQHKVGGQWILYRKHMKQGYTKSHTSEITKPGGEMKVVMNTKWTQKGRLFLYNLLKDENHYPQIDLETEE